MRFHVTKIIAASLFLASLQGCGAASFGGADEKKNTASKDKSTAGTDDEDVLSGEPAQVSGAFLTCEITEDDEAKSEVGLGCAMKKPDGKKASMDGIELEANVVDAKGKKTKVALFPEPEASDYNLRARVPREAIENGDFELVGKQGGKAKMRRKAVMKQMKKSLQKNADADIATDGASEKPYNGTPASQGEISSGNAVLTEAFGSLCGQDGELGDAVKRVAMTYSEETFSSPHSICFNAFINPAKTAKAISGFGEPAFVHSIAGGKCFLVSTGSAIQILQASENPDLTEDALMQFASKRICTAAADGGTGGTGGGGASGGADAPAEDEELSLEDLVKGILSSSGSG